MIALGKQLWFTQAQERDIPRVTRIALKATVLVVASNKSGDDKRQGSGFVVSDDGKVVTNYHVIQNADSAIIKFPQGGFYIVEGVLGVDKDRDIAVLKVLGKDFPMLKLGDSDTVEIGQEVIAIGSPLSLEATVSTGVISSIRELGDEPSERLKVIQTTAPISPGSSGGALMNTNGEVIGITTLQARGGQNLNFAIPINYAKPLLGSALVRPLAALSEYDAQNGKAANASASGNPSAMPLYWTDLRNGFIYKVRYEGEYIYSELIPGKEFGEYRSGVYHRCEFRKAKDETWTGKCWSRNPIACSSAWSGKYVTWCNLESTHVATKISNTRIEGFGDYPDTEKDFDCGKCRAKQTKRLTWVFIPTDKMP
jgi:hypothetical protein